MTDGNGMIDIRNINIVPNEPVQEESIIRVVGVGGGGCNAVSYMYDKGIEGCKFIVCNTDAQALAKSNVPCKVILGDGRGAGTKPEKAEKAAIESIDKICDEIIGDKTQMLFVTACLGGGTGTGASHVIANKAKEKGILTIGVVTIPFKYEGAQAFSKAQDGLELMRKSVDSLLIIDNNKLIEIYGKDMIHEAFPKVDKILETAVRGIIEIITVPGDINMDFEDVKTMMTNSGMALMGCGEGKGENRLEDAVKQALESPLLRVTDLKTARNLLLNITVSKNEHGVTMEEYDRISSLISDYIGNVDKAKRGLIYNESKDADDTVKITAIVTGFDSTIDVLKGIFGESNNRYIVIDEDYICPEDDMPTDNAEEGAKIMTRAGRNDNKPTFNFDDPPILFVGRTDDKSILQNTSAFRRKKSTEK